MNVHRRISIAGAGVDILLSGSDDRCIPSFVDELRRMPSREGADEPPVMQLQLQVSDEWQGPQEASVTCRALPDGSCCVGLERMDFSGELKSDEGLYRGSFVLDGRDPAVLAICLRACFSVVCEDRGELLLHASGVFRRGRLWLFCGPSGAGKSTIAESLTGGGEPWSFDRVVLSAVEGRILARSTLFSAPPQMPPGDGMLPVAGIFFIEQATAPALQPLTAGETLRRVFAETLLLTRLPENMRRVLDTAGALCDARLCHVLRFSRDASFWNLIDAMEDR